MRVFIPILVATVLIVPSFVGAQAGPASGPLSNSLNGPPNATPPTKAPDKLLPKTELPSEPVLANEGEVPGTQEGQPEAFFGADPSLSLVLLGASLLVAVTGLAWFMRRK